LQGLSIAIETVRIDEELMEIWPNEVCDTKEEEESKGGDKKPDPTNPEDLPKYVQLFMYLFNKKKFEKLPDRQE